jgi:hypothetical protein
MKFLAPPGKPTEAFARSLTRALWTVILVEVFITAWPAPAHAENRLYYLQVALRSGERYETISVADPFAYCSRNGGAVYYLRDCSLVYSPHMKVRILRSWIEPTQNLAGRWAKILKAHGMLHNHNHRALPRVPPLTLADMRRP